MKVEKFKLNRAGVRELLNSAGIEDVCVKTATELAGRAGTGYQAAAPHKTGQRVAVNIYPGTKEAARDNLKNNTLLKVIS